MILYKEISNLGLIDIAIEIVISIVYSNPSTLMLMTPFTFTNAMMAF